MPQYAILIYSGDSAHGVDSTTADLEEHHRHAQELEESGAVVAAFALRPRAMATSIRDEVVTDGPFAETAEVVAGFFVVDAPDLEAALAIAARNPAVRQGGGVEVRPVAGGFVRRD